MKRILHLILLFSLVMTAKAADGNWVIHPIFDEEVTHVVETPDYVYFTSKNLTEAGNTTMMEIFNSLFRFDKKGEELQALSTTNMLNSNSVRDIIYNPAKGYLAVLYKDYNLDFLYNNGKVVNMSAYMKSDLAMSKFVNSMAIDPGADRLYLATDFGYLAVNDKKNEIAESRIYGEPLKGFCRIGDTYLVLTEGALLSAPVGEPRLSLKEYAEAFPVENPEFLYPVNDNLALLITGNSEVRNVQIIKKDADGISVEDWFSGKVINIENIPNGVSLTGAGSIFQIKDDGSGYFVERPEEFSNCAAVTLNMTDIWNGMSRKGLNSIRKNGETWSVTRNWMLPNAPATFATTSFVNHPSYGFLMLDYGFLPATINLTSRSPLQLSGYKNGKWKNYSPAYTNPRCTEIMLASNGMAVDPVNSNYVYLTSYHNGILRLNLNDPLDIIHLSHEEDPDINNDWFVSFDNPRVSMPSYWNICAPYFDKKGNLWMSYANWDDSADPNPHFFCWLAEDLKATTSAKNIKKPKEVEFNVYMPVSNQSFSIPLLKTGNGLIVYAGGRFSEDLVILDTGGTPTDTKDDKVYKFESFRDQDGNAIDLSNMKFMWEDPSTGYVWLGHRLGLCYFVPSQVLAGNYQLNRVKVPRNDGTNLADYLLEGVAVNCLATDSEGRKWFGTAGGGVVCTSADGREILEEFTAANSMLPADEIFGIGYNSATNSLMISTAQGYAEYMLPVSSYSDVKEDVRAYPNPVRPDFSGYVTITDIPQGSFVKITDVAGNLVKDLGVMSGFEMLWDVADSNFKRVKSGVYHIMVSPGNEYSKYTAVGKILVMN